MSFIDPFTSDDHGKIITPTDLADALSLAGWTITPKSVRDRMRKMTEKANQPGSGNHWDIEVGSDAYFALVQSLQSAHRNKRVVRFAPTSVRFDLPNE